MTLLLEPHRFLDEIFLYGARALSTSVLQYLDDDLGNLGLRFDHRLLEQGARTLFQCFPRTPQNLRNLPCTSLLGCSTEKARERLLGEIVHLKGEAFRVIGFLERKGSFFGDTQDDEALIPISTATTAR